MSVSENGNEIVFQKRNMYSESFEFNLEIFSENILVSKKTKQFRKKTSTCEICDKE